MRLWQLTLLLLCFPASAATLNIAAEDAWPPFSDENGQGYSRELATAAFQLSGVTLNIQTVPYARALSMTLGGESQGCWNVTRQPSTEAQYVFGTTPLFKASASYYFKAGKEKNYPSPAAIPDGTRIAVINGYEYGDEFEHHKARFQLIPVSKQKQMLSLLLNERADMAIFFDRVFDYTLAHSPLSRSLFSKGHVNHVSDIYIAFSAADPKSRDYARMLDDGLKILKENGEYERIMNTMPTP
ncbi:substrate-binding periplasmic protein [Thalassolituus sp. LLYu03]|uniref:substrate-binding periplasmic protein n=1 Tax=Thalassolituus sp. LLYu03 TaxID=3421656 RepID=UPI003D28D95B